MHIEKDPRFIIRKTLTTEFKMPAVFFRTEKPLKKWAFAFLPDKSATFITGRLCITKKNINGTRVMRSLLSLPHSS